MPLTPRSTSPRPLLRRPLAVLAGLLLASCNGPQSPEPIASAPADEPRSPPQEAPREAPPPPGKAAAPAPDAGALTEDGKRRMVAELGESVKAWVAALDGGDKEALSGMVVSDEFLRKNINEGNYKILSGTILQKNGKVISQLLDLAAGREVKLVKWTPGTPTMTRVGQSIFTTEFPLISTSRLELSIGEWPVELELRQSVKDGDAWKFMEVSIRS